MLAAFISKNSTFVSHTTLLLPYLVMSQFLVICWPAIVGEDVIYFSGNAVGLIFPPEVSEDEKAGFELLLNQLTAVQQTEDLSHYEEYITLSGSIIFLSQQNIDFLSLLYKFKSHLREIFRSCCWRHDARCRSYRSRACKSFNEGCRIDENWNN